MTMNEMPEPRDKGENSIPEFSPNVKAALKNFGVITDAHLRSRGYDLPPEDAQLPMYTIEPYYLAWDNLHVVGTRKIELADGSLMMRKVDFSVIHRKDDGKLYFVPGKENPTDDAEPHFYPLGEGSNELHRALSKYALARCILN